MAMPYDLRWMDRILIVGATGTVGRHVGASLIAAGAQVRALVRNPETAHLPSQIEVARGDLTVPASLEEPLKGVAAVFLVWTAAPESIDPVVQRIAEKAQRIVFLSAPLKTPHPFFQQPNPIRRLAEKIEHLIAQSGLQWTFLRPGIFAANALRWWAPQIRAGNTVRWPYLTASTSPIHERDIATVAVHALCENKHAGTEYVLTGPQSLTQREQVLTIGRAIGRKLRVEEMTADEARREWTAAMWPPSVVDMLLDAWAAATGQPAFISTTFEEITGVKPQTFLSWVIDHEIAFQR